MMCKCGHGKSMHNKGCAAGDINVGCACSSFEPAAESDPEYVDLMQAAKKVATLTAAESQQKRAGRHEVWCNHDCNCGADAESEWLSKPDGDGWWTVTFFGALPTFASVLVKGDKFSYDPHRGVPASWRAVPDNFRWQRIKMPPPPPAPLPREKTVTLTAKVYQRGDGKWDANVEVAGYYLPGPYEYQESKSALVQWVRNTYGIEPTVEDGQ